MKMHSYEVSSRTSSRTSFAPTSDETVLAEKWAQNAEAGVAGSELRATTADLAPGEGARCRAA
jgi:hypothetical protein